MNKRLGKKDARFYFRGFEHGFFVFLAIFEKNFKFLTRDLLLIGVNFCFESERGKNERYNLFGNQ